MKIRPSLLAIGLVMLALVSTGPSHATTKSEVDASATKALANFYALNPKHKELSDKAAGVLVFGRITKAGAGIAGEYGEGVLMVNGAPVDYYSVTSASVGLTLGAAHHREVILFMTQDSLDKFIKSDGWSAGADASFALVSRGASGQYDTVTLRKPVLGFVFHEQGLLGDASLEGSKITKLRKIN